NSSARSITGAMVCSVIVSSLCLPLGRIGRLWLYRGGFLGGSLFSGCLLGRQLVGKLLLGVLLDFVVLARVHQIGPKHRDRNGLDGLIGIPAHAFDRLGIDLLLKRNQAVDQ